MRPRRSHSIFFVCAVAACELRSLPDGTGGAATGGGGSTTCAAHEIPCNGIDDDCDPATPDGLDLDGDGVTDCTDCDDHDPSVHPGALDRCEDGIDQDCSGDEVGCSRCGDGIANLDAGEECDPPQDGACPGSCDACMCPSPPGPWRFVDVTVKARLTAHHDWDASGLGYAAFQGLVVSGGVAASDLDGDGFAELYVVGCMLGESALYHNDGDGRFTNITSHSGIVPATPCEAGPLFGDLTGDGIDDLFVGGVASTPSKLWVGLPNGKFVDGTSDAGIDGMTGNAVSAALADTDLDGDLDLAVGRWTASVTHDDAYFENDAGVLVPSTEAAGLGALSSVTFTPNFADMNGDDLLDLLFVSDFHQTRYYFGNGDGTFTDATKSVVSDQNGMGAAIGDVDGDGDLDWFVSSIWDPNGLPEGGWGTSGNRLYQNQGDGQLKDVTAFAGVRAGYWGWGACLADFDNDGDLDLFQTNGASFPRATEFHKDPSVLFISNGDGTFTERAFELGIQDRGEGRGVVCFDYDRDGDIDILVQHNRGGLSLYENNGAKSGHFIDVALRAPPPNARAIGARVEVTAGDRTWVGVIRAGSNYASQDPAELHFGLGPRTAIDSIVVVRPGGSTTTFGASAADQRLVLDVP